MFRLNPRFAVLMLAVTLGGCGPEEMMKEETDTETEAVLATAEQELVGSGSYVWTSSSAATPMGTSTDRFCFLEKVRGRLDGPSDHVRIFAADGSWYLHGNAGSGGPLQAGARCAYRSGGVLSGEYEWTPGQNLPTNMGTASGRVCFLTRVDGEFNSGGHWIRAYVSGGSWFLFGSSSKVYGRARARCITVPSYSGEYVWSQGQSYGEHMGTTTNRVCALVYMAGEFASFNEYVDILPTAGSYYLRGSSSTYGVAARARCF
ncbi:hypothetical protein [Pyxidicoccus sp. MSG2]|uniref:hypothetical protein n=1 Tax=Pyxidicoccus sp. MSG2 TaxID=2996790 RepID=UPI00226E5816|nr:hypothetical protein [Pyxidicoccus sp. MSG2]MCY1018153.1 hypothetical protein [Pyxidicoccus sp. MSG2]